jgi:endonuclease III
VARGAERSRGVAARRADALLDACGQTYAAQAGIRLRDTPAPLFQLLVLSVLLSARISADIGVRAARELVAAGCTTPERMEAATWQERVDALGRGGYRRYDERTSTMLGDGARLVRERWGGDLRRLRAEAEDDPDRVSRLLQEVPGIGPTGAAIFCREVQGVWPSLAPFVDRRAGEGAERAGLPGDPAALARLVPAEELPRLVAACVRVARDEETARRVRDA